MRVGGGEGVGFAWGCEVNGRRFYSPGEAAAVLGISTRTVLRAIASGRLRAIRVNSRVLRISAADLEAWCDEMYTTCS